MTNYEERLKIPITGNADSKLMTESGLIIASGYARVVLGGRGPYVEFSENQIDIFQCAIPDNQKWRLTNSNVYYLEYRTNDDSHVKIYHQTKIVDYADYKIGMYYVSPFALLLDDGTRVIEPLRKKKNVPL